MTVALLMTARAFALPVFSDGQVRLFAVQRADENRLVLSFPEQVDFKEKISGDDYTLVFDAAVSNPDALNVGKSSFINRVAGGKRAKVEDRPGVTRGKQWVTLEKGIDLLDMPGVLWPKFDDKTVGEHLAFTGAIKDDILDTELLAMRLADLLNREYHSLLCERYRLTDEETADIEPYDLLSLIGAKRGMKISGGEVDTERAAAMLLDEFRGGKIGRMTLEMPNELV